MNSLSALFPLHAGPLSSYEDTAIHSESETDTQSDADGIGALTLEFEDNPEVSIMKSIEHMALLDPVSALNLAKMVLEDKLFSEEMESRLRLKLEDILATLREQQPENNASAFAENAADLTLRTEEPLAIPTPEPKLQPAFGQPGPRPFFG